MPEPLIVLLGPVIMLVTVAAVLPPTTRLLKINELPPAMLSLLPPLRILMVPALLMTPPLSSDNRLFVPLLSPTVSAEALAVAVRKPPLLTINDEPMPPLEKPTRNAPF